jgi:hypothetical protein
VISTQPGQLSPDGLWRWDGARWVANQVTPLPAPPATKRRSSLAVSSGITAIVGAVVVVVGCVVPYAYFPGDSSGQSASSSSIFDGGFSGSWAYAIEPVIVIAVVLVGALLVIVGTSRTLRALMAGVLCAMGAQTMAMFLGYAVATFSFSHLQAGGFIGALGGLIVLAGGAMAALSLTGSV